MPAPPGDEDLTQAVDAARALSAFEPTDVPLSRPARSIVQTAATLACVQNDDGLHQTGRIEKERRNGQLLSYFVQEGTLNRHVVCGGKDRLTKRRHGTILRTGENLLPDENALSATVWMHGVFAAQLAGSAFHKLFSVSRDAFNIVRTGGLRILAEIAGEWRLLAEPSAFEMGLGDCRWVYRTDGRTITVHAVASIEDSAFQWEIAVEGEPCRFLIFGHIVLGERDYASAGPVEVDAEAKRFTFRPDPDSVWGKHYPHAVYHLVTSTPAGLEALGGSELLYEDGGRRATPHSSCAPPRPANSASP